MISIRPMDRETADLYDRIDNPYEAHEAITVHYANDAFTLRYDPLSPPRRHTYPPNDIFTAQELIRREDAACFLAWADGQPAGQAVVTTHWNRLAMLWDIRVDESLRGKGIGRALIDACAAWAKSQGLQGLVAETQASNPSACRFYQRSGFQLGGVDRLLYAAIHRPHAGSQDPPDYALFFYQLFS